MNESILLINRLDELFTFEDEEPSNVLKIRSTTVSKNKNKENEGADRGVFGGGAKGALREIVQSVQS